MVLPWCEFAQTVKRVNFLPSATVASPAAEQTSSTAFKCLVDTVAQNHSSYYLLTQLLNKNQQSEILRRMKNAEADTNQLKQQLASQQPRIPIPQELQFPI
ncbi:uncharacterized protein LOC119768803 [Culex quinquefasciatus]|uniref:uncharacterized protein LOC119768803 n=1 Tax=Culex quinquefasciatus TaxID=7176 RepID=UPI0018E2AF55|nr:uncharacterized protein LOC119768803 [Culex quinquefasciatus]